MYRPRSYTFLKSGNADAVVTRAMHYFREKGCRETGLRDIAAETGIPEHSLYAEFGSWHGLFTAAFRKYMEDILLHGFAVLETGRAGLAAIGKYFHMQIDRIVRFGLPGRGCFMTTALMSPLRCKHDIEKLADLYMLRMENGFMAALRYEARKCGLENTSVGHLATFLVTSVAGLWIYGHYAETRENLEAYKDTVIDIVREKLFPE